MIVAFVCLFGIGPGDRLEWERTGWVLDLDYLISFPVRQVAPEGVEQKTYQ